MNQFQPIQNPNPNPYNSTLKYPYASTSSDQHPSFTSDFELSDFLMVDDGSDLYFSLQNVAAPSDYIVSSRSNEEEGAENPRNENLKINRLKEGKQGKYLKVAFRTQSGKDVIDDGFKWRKYGKKMVKASPHPRNYYKCSSGGCGVKKRVERDSEDPSYVITTYEGKHNHQSPCLVYYNETPLMVPQGWTLQASTSNSHSSSSS